jgi:hypothetical protein
MPEVWVYGDGKDAQTGYLVTCDCVPGAKDHDITGEDDHRPDCEAMASAKRTTQTIGLWFEPDERGGSVDVPACACPCFVVPTRIGSGLCETMYGDHLSGCESAEHAKGVLEDHRGEGEA